MDSVLFAYDTAADAAYTDVEGPTRQVKKVYLSLWPENVIRMDWKTPMEKFDGRTPLEVAVEGYDFHKTQHGGRRDFNKRPFWFKVRDGGMLDNILYGLARTIVGLDADKRDFLRIFHK